MDITIRKFKKTDEVAFKKTITAIQTLDRTYKEGYIAPEKMVDDWFDLLMEDKKTYDGEIYVADVDGNAVGFLSIRLEPPTEESEIFMEPDKNALITHYYVFPEFRGKGIGKRLLINMEDYAKKRHVRYVRTYVCAGNKNAREIYQRFGFIDEDIIIVKKIQ